jgi:Flp pilus assembly protein CpaB
MNTVKNFIPVVIAIALGLLGVLMVKGKISQTGGKDEKSKTVLVAKRDFTWDDISKGENELKETDIAERSVRESAMPVGGVTDRKLAVNHRIQRPINKGEYILYSHLEERNLGNDVAQGEWGVPVTFNETSLLPILKRGDEIAIIGTYRIKELVKNDKNVDAKPQEISRTVTNVIYPCVKILNKINNSTVILSVPPDQALVLITIQQKCELYPVLRRPNDNGNMKREDIGLFDEKDTNKFIEGLDSVYLPSSAQDMRKSGGR